MATKRKSINFIIGQRVRSERDASEKTQEELAERLFTTGANISRKEAGKIPFTVEELYLAAEFLECGLSRLLPPAGGDEDEWSPEGSIAAAFGGIPSDMQPIVLEMVKAAHKAALRNQTTHGRKAE